MAWNCNSAALLPMLGWVWTVVSIVDIATDGGGNNDETEKQQVFSQYYNHLWSKLYKKVLILLFMSFPLCRQYAIMFWTANVVCHGRVFTTSNTECCCQIQSKEGNKNTWVLFCSFIAGIEWILIDICPLVLVQHCHRDRVIVSLGFFLQPRMQCVGRRISISLAFPLCAHHFLVHPRIPNTWMLLLLFLCYVGLWFLDSQYCNEHSCCSDVLSLSDCLFWRIVMYLQPLWIHGFHVNTIYFVFWGLCQTCLLDCFQF